MKAIQKTNKHMMEEIGKTSQKRDREGPRGPKVIFFSALSYSNFESCVKLTQ